MKVAGIAAWNKRPYLTYLWVMVHMGYEKYGVRLYVFLAYLRKVINPENPYCGPSTDEMGADCRQK